MYEPPIPDFTERVRHGPPGSVLIPRIPSQESNGERMAPAVLDELKPLGYLP
jgi:hypothetical protein